MFGGEVSENDDDDDDENAKNSEPNEPSESEPVLGTFRLELPDEAWTLDQAKLDSVLERLANKLYELQLSLVYHFNHTFELQSTGTRRYLQTGYQVVMKLGYQPDGLAGQLVHEMESLVEEMDTECEFLH